MYKIKGYGRRSDLGDLRDYLFHERNAVLPVNQAPLSVDLTAKMPIIYDQGQLGSCTGNGWARILEYRANVAGDEMGTPSRLFIYYNERVIENTVDQDSGAEVRSGAKVVSSQGAPLETDWAYDISKFTDKPPQAAYDDAVKHKALEYQRIVVGVPGAPMRTALSQGLPIVFGFSVPDYFEGSWDPITTPLPVPDSSTTIIGGHCVVITGYDFTCKKFKAPAFHCDNSWGPDWGEGGRFWIDYRWFNPNPGLANDLWVIQQAS